MSAADDELKKRMLIGYDPGFDDLSNARLYSYAKPLEDAMLEADDALRARIAYVAGAVALNVAGAKLEALAERYGLKRRKIELKIPAKLTPEFAREYLGSWKAWT